MKHWFWSMLLWLFSIGTAQYGSWRGLSPLTTLEAIGVRWDDEALLIHTALVIGVVEVSMDGMQRSRVDLRYCRIVANMIPSRNEIAAHPKSKIST